MPNFTIPYTTPANYTYDAAKIDIVGGLATLKDLTTSNARLYNSFDTGADANWADGSKVGILNGVPTFSGGKMVCVGAQGVYFTANSLTIETYKVKYTPNYTGSPSTNVNIMGTGGTNTINDRCLLTHSPSGDNFRITLNNSSGTLILLAATIGGSSVNLQAGIEYELELTINSLTGTIRLFKDGVLHGTLTPGVWSRGGISKRYTVGAATSTYNTAQGSFNDFIIFDNEQHTSGYTPGYTPSPTIYAIDEPTIYKTAGDSIADIAEWIAFTETLGISNQGSLKYQLSEDGITWYYWNGSNWVVAGATNYNTVSEVNTNISEFSADADSIFIKAFLISNGDQEIQLDNNSIGYVINTVPSVYAGTDKNAIYNTSMNPFSDSNFSDAEDNIVKAEWKEEGGSYVEIPQGAYGTLLAAVQAFSYIPTHSGNKNVYLKITDSYAEFTEDILVVNVNQVTVTVNIQDSNAVHLSGVSFNPGDGGATASRDSSFSYTYLIGTHTASLTKTGFNNLSQEVVISIATTVVDFVMTLKTQLADLTLSVTIPTSLYVGDYFELYCDADGDLTGYQIRANLFDNSGHSLQFANVEAGGSESEIANLVLTEGQFLIQVQKDTTDLFDPLSFIEIEIEDNGEKYTIYHSEIELKPKGW